MLSKYQEIYQEIYKNNRDEVNYLAAIKSFVDSLENLDLKIDIHELRNLLIPKHIHKFEVPFTNDEGVSVKYLGWRVQHNNKLGVFKGGLRFHPSVDVSTLKFLAFEQTLKNSLTGLPLGGAKGGANFDPKGKSQDEIKRFTKAFMAKLAPYIGSDVDVPAGDIGVGKSEILWMMESYLEQKPKSNLGFITGKPVTNGGSYGRIEATGYGLVYIVEEALSKFYDETIKGKKVIVSGSGNVAINAALKLVSLGALVVGMSDSSGFVYCKTGLDVNHIKELKTDPNVRIKSYLDKYPTDYCYRDTKGLFMMDADIILPCATQNEIDFDIAQKIDFSKVKIIAEGANRPLSNEAIDYVSNKCIFIPGKASNAGGVVVSYLEMQQNQAGVQSSFEEVDLKLKSIMHDIFTRISAQALKLGQPRNLLLGANIEGLIRLIK